MLILSYLLLKNNLKVCYFQLQLIFPPLPACRQSICLQADAPATAGAFLPLNSYY